MCSLPKRLQTICREVWRTPEIRMRQLWKRIELHRAFKTEITEHINTKRSVTRIERDRPRFMGGNRLQERLQENDNRGHRNPVPFPNSQSRPWY